MLLIFLGLGCNRDPIVDIDSDPVFVTQFALDGAEYSIEAGVDSVYLFTDFRQDAGPLMVLTGAFASADCPDANCPGTLAFEFFNDKIGDLVSPDTLFTISNLEYYTQGGLNTDTVYRYTFYTQDTVDYNAFNWAIDGQPVSTDPTFSRDFPNQLPHSVRLIASNLGSVKSWVARTVSPDTTQYPKVGILIGNSDSIPGYYELTAVTSNGPFTFRWSTNDSVKTITKGPPLDEFYSVRVKNVNNDTAFARIYPFNAGAINGKTADINYFVTKIPPDPLPFGRVNIRWIDENGFAWESGKGTQNADAYFQILDSEPYEKNENGQKTWKLTVGFACKVYFNSSTSILSKVLTGNAVIAVGYP